MPFTGCQVGNALEPVINCPCEWSTTNLIPTISGTSITLSQTCPPCDGEGVTCSNPTLGFTSPPHVDGGPSSELSLQLFLPNVNGAIEVQSFAGSTMFP